MAEYDLIKETFRNDAAPEANESSSVGTLARRFLNIRAKNAFFDTATILSLVLNLGTGYVKSAAGTLSVQATPIPLSDGSTGLSAAVAAGYVKSTGSAYTSQPTPLPAADGGLGAALPASGYLKGGASVSSQATPIPATDGGLGVNSPTAHGVLVAEGAAAVNPIVLTNGQVLIGSTGVDPVAAVPTAGNGVQITPGAGSLLIATLMPGLRLVTVFTASGTWNRSAGSRKVIVEEVGAGGGGAGTDATATRTGGGGGGGGYAVKLLDVTSIASSTITVGAAGSGGAAGANPGGAGGNSSWADGTNTITANGGAGGAAVSSPNTFAAGGTASGGDVNLTGQSGSPNQTAAQMLAGEGGSSQLGRGAQATPLENGGSAGQNYGGGGGGANNATAVARAGGNGAGGIVIVWEFE